MLWPHNPPSISDSLEYLLDNGLRRTYTWNRFGTVLATPRPWQGTWNLHSWRIETFVCCDRQNFRYCLSRLQDSELVTDLCISIWLYHEKCEAFCLLQGNQELFDWLWVEGVPQKGSLLTKLSARWFEFLKSEIPTLHTHFIELSIPETLRQSVPERLAHQLQDRTMQVRRLKVFPIEAIVRGYVTGSAWKEYTEKGTIHGITISGPGGRRLQESDKLEKPIYTPCKLGIERLDYHEHQMKIANVWLATKAEPGSKDENIHPDQGMWYLSRS